MPDAKATPAPRQPVAAPGTVVRLVLVMAAHAWARLVMPRRVWAGTPSRALGLHTVDGIPGTVIRWDRSLPHARFLRAVERVAPEVLVSLRDEVLPGRVPLAAWAERWHLAVPWMLDVAEATLRAWRARGVPARLRFWRPVRYVLARDRDMVRMLKAEGLEPADWRRRVQQEREGFMRWTDEDRRSQVSPRDAKRLALWQVLGWGPERIARAELADGLRGTPDRRGKDVLAVVVGLHARLALPPRPPGRPGRPRRD